MNVPPSSGILQDALLVRVVTVQRRGGPRISPAVHSAAEDVSRGRFLQRATPGTMRAANVCESAKMKRVQPAWEAG
jgi:hypothetical protein